MDDGHKTNENDQNSNFLNIFEEILDRDLHGWMSNPLEWNKIIFD